ncbi:hypothetical protein CPEBRM1_ABPJDJAI_00877 [Companilactobacillus paralimentarius]|uniref:hypothetical protein n=1 Tax=Companilactobacillus paralimentarius TaxID=83526 RepID=UPI00384D8D52
MKRQLDSKYSDLVDWVNDKKQRLGLREIVVYITCPPRNLYEIIYALYGDNWRSDENLNDTISSIVDIYNDNYELTEPKYYWKFNAMNFMSYPIKAYAGKVFNEIELVTNNDAYEAYYCSKSKLIKFLAISDTNLTINDFTPVEEIEND